MTVSLEMGVTAVPAHSLPLTLSEPPRSSTLSSFFVFPRGLYVTVSKHLLCPLTSTAVHPALRT